MPLEIELLDRGCDPINRFNLTTVTSGGLDFQGLFCVQWFQVRGLFVLLILMELLIKLSFYNNMHIQQKSSKLYASIKELEIFQTTY